MLNEAGTTGTSTIINPETLIRQALGEKYELQQVIGKGGMATISVNGKKVAEGRIEKTQPMLYSADETADVGLDNQTPVAEDIGIGREETRFTGKIHKITVEVKADK